MIPYLECPHPDDSKITLQYFEHISDVPYLNESHSVPLHQHEFYEMVVILRGFCHHFYRDANVLLIPGDLFLIPPNQPHSYQFYDDITLCNCQFYREALGNVPENFIGDVNYLALQQKNSARKRLQDMEAFQEDEGSIPFWHTGDINSQGIIHLNKKEREIFTAAFMHILDEQEQQMFEFKRIKQMTLEYILIETKRAQMRQFDHDEHNVSWKNEMIDTVLTMIENDISYNYDFNKIAASQHITTSYFRSIFKNITGLTPIEYLNRTRILRALELLQTTDYTIAEVAEIVGIYDPNYFSRLFKQIIGYPPSYFKKIKEPRSEVLQ